MMTSNIENALIKAKVKQSTDLELTHKQTELLAGESISDINNMHESEVIDDSVLSKLKITHHGMENNDLFNQFRALRTTIMQNININNACILVYSTIPEGGASYVSVNLASAIALDQKRTSLLINCDYKKSALYEELLNHKRGLIDYLLEDINVKEIIHPCGIRRLRIIPSGEITVSFGEFFTTNKLRNLLAELKKKYHDRTIILDGPSSLDVADIKLLSEFADAALLIVPYGKNSADDVNRAASLVSKDKLLGIVINNKQTINLFK